MQAFGKVGVKGAVVWVGYSWRDGAKAEWGALLNKLVTDFSNGGVVFTSVHVPCYLSACRIIV